MNKHSLGLLLLSFVLANNAFVKVTEAFVSSPQEGNKPLYFSHPVTINRHRFGIASTSSSLTAVPTEKRPLSSMLDVSQLVYQYVYIRRMVLNHEKTMNENNNLSEEEKNERPIIEFDTPALVVTQNAAEEARKFKKSKLKHVITAAAIREFIQKNRSYIKENDSGNLAFDQTGQNKDVSEVEKRLIALEHNFDADIIEYDDFNVNKGLRSELLYSVIVNRTDKRITVCFRGTAVTDGNKDIVVDSEFCQKKPEDFEELNGKEIKIHKGFYNYLFTQKDNKGQSKFEHICELLEEVYAYRDNVGEGMDYSDYSLYVTGHSLGGSLSQLFAFAIAGTNRAKSFLPEGKPVVSVTYASPQAGNKGYETYFNELEKKGRLRHLRVSNEGDLICFGLGCFHPGYTQPGVNIHLFGEKEEPDIAYNRIYKSFTFNNPLEMHSLDSYRNRLLPNDAILEKSVEEFYSDFGL